MFKPQFTLRSLFISVGIVAALTCAYLYFSNTDSAIAARYFDRYGVFCTVKNGSVTHATITLGDYSSKIQSVVDNVSTLNSLAIDLPPLTNADIEAIANIKD